VRVKIGRLEFDTVTPEEHRQITREELDAHDAHGRPLTELVRPEESGQTDATGALLLPIYRPPAGMEFRVHLLSVEADGFTEAVPFNGAGAYFRAQIDGRKFDAASLVAAAANGVGLPFVRQYGESQGGVALNNEAVELVIVAGPANTLVRALVQGVLIPRPGTPPER
jgi:hypothetical protein